MKNDGKLIAAGLTGLLLATMFVACGGSDGAASNAGNDAGGADVQSDVDAGGTETSTSSGACADDPATAENTAKVVDAANAFLSSLTAEQKTAVSYEKTLANAEQWSNLPTSFVKRNGVRIGDMSAAAEAAAVALAEVAAGTTGAKLLSEIREADEWLVTNGGASTTDYGRGLYYVSIHGAPSTSAAWMLQIAGHHLAYNFTYNGKCTSATPLFDGVEPTTWTDGSGAMHAPLEAQRASMAALFTSVGAAAQLTGTYSDLINGPVGGGPGGAGGDTKYPSSLTYPSGTSGRGALVSSLSAEQKALVKTTIEAWVKNVADPVSAALLAAYESDDALAHTYVGYSGSADLSTQASYGRIDGPRVWIEFTVQGGIIYKGRVHYHTIWRDKASDYGAEYVSQ